MDRFYSYNSHLKKIFGQKVYKLSLSISSTCPNRDGKAGVGGCIFCAGGSGEFAAEVKKSISEQIRDAKERVKDKNRGGKYIAYFQSYTSTYMPADSLRVHLNAALSEPDVVGISVGTRADCLGDDILAVLKEVAEKTHLTVELGLQTSNDKTAAIINRCCPLEKYIEATENLHKIGVEVVYHIILGLPFENEETMLDTVRFAVKNGSDGVKLQLLHVLKGTPLCEMYERGEFETLSLSEYCEILGKALEILPPTTVIHRLTGDAPKRILIAPEWSADKKKVLNTITRYFEQNDIIQGKKYPESL